MLHTEAWVSASAAAGAVALSGQAGPQAVTAEEIVTVPVAFWRGNKIGRTAQMFMMEAGHAYNEMLEAGIPEKTARKLALAVGTVNASLEMFQVDELLDAYKVVKKSGATPNITKRIFKELAVRGIDLGVEVGTEVLQDGVTIAGTQAGSKIANGKWAYSAEEIDERLKNTAKDSLSTFGMMNIPAVSKNIYGITQNRKVGWDGRVAVTDADGSKVTVGGKTYELLGLDENGSKVYQDVEVLKEENVSTKGEAETYAVDKNSEELLENQEKDSTITSRLTVADVKTVQDYMSAQSYMINGKLRTEMPLTEEETALVSRFNETLDKMPVYRGDLQRSLFFEDAADVQEFLIDYTPGETIKYSEFISTTKGKNQYNPDGQVQILIRDSQNGRDISSINDSEQEVVYKTDSEFVVINVIERNGKYYIILEEGNYE